MNYMIQKNKNKHQEGNVMPKNQDKVKQKIYTRMKKTTHKTPFPPTQRKKREEKREHSREKTRRKLKKKGRILKGMEETRGVTSHK